MTLVEANLVHVSLPNRSRGQPVCDVPNEPTQRSPGTLIRLNISSKFYDIYVYVIN